MSRETYRINSFKFLGSDDDGFFYVIKFNRSLQDTERMVGIVEGLDRAERKQRRKQWWVKLISKIWKNN
jgi:hypothetical protein